MSRAAPLLPPSLLTPHAARLASSSLAPHRVGTMRWHAYVCHVAASIRPLVQLTSSPTAYGQMPSTLPPRKAAATATSLLRLAARARSLCRRAEPSPPSLSPCSGPRCPHAMHGYKRDLPHAFYPRLWFHRLSVPEHPITLKQLLEAWQTSPPTSEQLPEAWQTSPPTSEQLSET
jgi:hypothetical protein